MKTSNYQYAFPRYSLADLDVVDVGCHDGRDFKNPIFKWCKSLRGLDVDREAIARASGDLKTRFVVGCAEHLPYADRSADVYISRVTLVLSHIPMSLGEAARVLRPGGSLFISMHDARLQWEFFRTAFGAGAWIRCLDMLAYVLPATILFNLLGWCMPRPWNGLYETFQTRRRMMKELRKAGFVSCTVERWGHHIVYQAKRSTT